MKPLIPEPVFDPETVLFEAPSSRLCAHVAKDGRPLPEKIGDASSTGTAIGADQPGFADMAVSSSCPIIHYSSRFALEIIFFKMTELEHIELVEDVQTAKINSK